MKRIAMAAGLVSAVALSSPAPALAERHDFTSGLVISFACLSEVPLGRSLCAGYATAILDMLSIYEPEFVRCVPKVENRLALMTRAMRVYLADPGPGFTRVDAFVLVMNAIERAWPCEAAQ